MIRILLGLQLAEDNCLPVLGPGSAFDLALAPRAFVTFLEGHLGCAYPSGEVDFLRAEQYRQLCASYVAADPEVFFAASFEADQRATATELLSRRDELLSSGLSLQRLGREAPPRLAVIGAIEKQLLAHEKPWIAGFADRLDQLCHLLSERSLPAMSIHLHEPRCFLPPGLARMLAILEGRGINISVLPEALPTDTLTDLGQWQASILGRQAPQGQAIRREAKADGSIVLLKAKRETHLAAFLARLLREDAHWRPAVLLPKRDQTLNDALVLEGLPDVGVSLSSLGRPGLQVLKLISVFLWEPVDIRKIMEFLNLLVKPLDDHLASYLAKHLADSPGLYGERWNTAVKRYFEEELPRRQLYDKQLKAAEVSAQFEIWFQRKRYPKDGKVPTAAVRSLFSFLLNWAQQQADNKQGANQLVLQQLAAQAKRMLELIDTIPEAQLSFLETDRLVRSVYAPSATCFAAKEVGSLAVAYEAAAVYDRVDSLVWWNFIEQDPNYFFSRWTREELRFLHENGITLLSPEVQNNRLLWQWQRPVLHCQQQLICCLPERIRGEEAQPHALLGELEAVFGAAGLASMTIDIDQVADNNTFWPEKKRPGMQAVPLQLLDKPKAHIQIQKPAALTARVQETPTGLEKLLFYPHQWAFEYGAKLRTNELLDIAADNRLRGNLAHRLLEKLLNARDNQTWDKETTVGWVNANFNQLLRQEGAIFLEYGREPERVQLLNILRYSSWALVDSLQQNNWEVVATEASLEGSIAGLALKGRADLLLRRGASELAIVDLKWRGKSIFSNLIKNSEDIQLSLYADFVGGEGQRVHTAYFIFSDGTLIARNQEGFQEAQAVSPEADHQMLQAAMLKRVAATYQWRRAQLDRGELEIRCEATAASLDDSYSQLDYTDLLEMKDKDSRFDKYQTLIGLVR